MRIFTSSIIAAATLVGRASSDPVRYCPKSGNNICFSVGVPQASASSSSGNIYFQISAPTQYSWVALGTGTGMAGSNMFIMYQDGKGNVTLSPRRGTFHTTPPVDTSSTGAKLTLLAGSGVSSDGKTMTANVACSNCENWSGGGKLSLTDTSSGWISAWLSGDSLASTSPNANIQQHDDVSTFQLDLTRATLASDSNPFVTSENTGSGSGSGNGNGGGNSSGSGSGSGSDSDSGVTVISSGTPSASILTAHAVIMAIVMVILYPLGALVMPLVGIWWVHAGWQVIAFLLMWAAFGLGVKAAQDRQELFAQTHTLFGTVIVCLFVVQPVLGFLQHSHYSKVQSRGIFGHAHIWYGRILIVLGIINGGLGLQLSQARNSLIIAYGVVAGVLFLVYASGTVLLSTRKRRGQASGGRVHKEASAQSMSGST